MTQNGILSLPNDMKTMRIAIGSKVFSLHIYSPKISDFLSHIYKGQSIVKKKPFVVVDIRHGSSETQLDVINKKVTISILPTEMDNIILFDMLRGAVSQFLPLENIFLLHASVIVYRDEAYIFSGQIGAGKSTIRKLLSTYLSYGDDTAVLERHSDGWKAHPSPFYETSKRIYAGHAVPIHGIYFIYHNKTNKIKRLSQSEAYMKVAQNLKLYLQVPYILQKHGLQSFQKKDGIAMNDLCEHAACQIPCYSLGFTNTNIAFWNIIQYTQ